MDYTVKVNSVCAGGNHYFVTITDKDGVSHDEVLQQGDLPIEDIQLVDASPKELVVNELKKLSLEKSVTNFEDLKQHVDEKSFVISADGKAELVDGGGAVDVGGEAADPLLP